MIQARKAKILGPGDNRLNVVCAETSPKPRSSPLTGRTRSAKRSTFNDGEITQKQYFDLLARSLGAAPVTAHAPYRAAYFVAFIMECVGHLLRSRKPPFVTRYAVWLMGRRSYFPAEKARQQLGWKSTVTYDVGIPMTVKWYREQLAASAGPGSAGVKQATAVSAAT